MYKMSKFTFKTTDNYGNLLLYNTYIGKYSFCKICDKTAINSIVKNELSGLSENSLKRLADKGIVVEANEDENKKMFSQFLDIVSPRKLNLIINPTEHCNFRCKYCYETFKNGEMSKQTQEELISFVRDNIHKYSGLNVSWFGGEPLLAKNVIEDLSDNFMRICQFNKRTYRATMTTNGYLLDIDTFRKMLDSQINLFQITIDGIQSIHDSQRVTVSGTGTYKKIFDNLLEIKNSKIRNFNIVLRTNFTQEIFDHFDEYLNSISVLCENDPRFSIACYKVGKWGDFLPNELLSKLVSDASEGMRQIYTRILACEKRISVRTDYLNPGMGLCYGGKKNSFVISSAGSIHKCTINFEEPGSIIGSFSGNKIQYNSKYYRYIANPSRCKSYYDCFFAPVCTGDPCPLKSDKDRKCSFVKDNLDLVLKISDRYEPFDIIA